MTSSSSFTSPARDLLPEDIVEMIPRFGKTVLNHGPVFHLKWFTTDSSFTWYVSEFDPESKMAFGLVVGQFPIWGKFSATETTRVLLSLGLIVERDLEFKPCHSSTITDELFRPRFLW